MRPLLIFLLMLLPAVDALAWSAAGHRLTAVIAWQQMDDATRRFVGEVLRSHPDHGRWAEKAGGNDLAQVFAEASTWPDSIRRDPRFADNAPPAPLPGFPDMQRHLDWHYVDIASDGKRTRGQLDRKIDELSDTLRTSADGQEIAWALPWLTHLVTDLHQPFHTGFPEDRGGNRLLVEDPDDANRPFVDLHTWWDALPGKSSLRGKRLIRKAGALQAGHTPPRQGDTMLWREESRSLLVTLYPESLGSVSLLIDAAYRERAQRIGEQRIVAAGWRLARLLDAIRRQRVPRGTAASLSPQD